MLSYCNDFCNKFANLKASETQGLLAKKTCLWLNQWMTPRVSLICLCMRLFEFIKIVYPISTKFYKDWHCGPDFP